MSKRAEEVASVPLDIFTIFGAPSILQSDNGRNSSTKYKYGKYVAFSKMRKPSFENMISSWLGDNNNKKWPEGLRYCQFLKIELITMV